MYSLGTIKNSCTFFFRSALTKAVSSCLGPGVDVNVNRFVAKAANLIQAKRHCIDHMKWFFVSVFILFFKRTWIGQRLYIWLTNSVVDRKCIAYRYMWCFWREFTSFFLVFASIFVFNSSKHLSLWHWSHWISCGVYTDATPDYTTGFYLNVVSYTELHLINRKKCIYAVCVPLQHERDDFFLQKRKKLIKTTKMWCLVNF